MELANLVVNVLPTLLAMAVGAVITLAVSKHFYARAADDLKQVATDLRGQLQLVLRGMDVEWTRDAAGNIIGVVVRASAIAKGHSSVFAQGDVTP